MLIDLHAHYPMHVTPRARRRTHAQLERWRRAWLRAWIVRLLSRFFNYQGPGDEPGVTLELMRHGDVGVIFSALYCPFDEIDLGKRYGAPPENGYFCDLLEQLEDVEADVRAHRDAGAHVTIAHSPEELEQALASGAQILIHSVEGGFHLGATDEQVREHVATLARRGVVCITVAHLFWRKLATNAPALPFMPDWLYRLIFHQPRHVGVRRQTGEADAISDAERRRSISARAAAPSRPRNAASPARRNTASHTASGRAGSNSRARLSPSGAFWAACPASSPPGTPSARSSIATL